MTLGCYYGSNDVDLEPMKNMLEKIDNLENEEIILIGDFQFGTKPAPR
jgi:hypothetical protein